MDGTGRPSRRRLHEGCERCAFYVGTDEDDNFIELHVMAGLAVNPNGSWNRFDHEQLEFLGLCR